MQMGCVYTTTDIFNATISYSVLQRSEVKAGRENSAGRKLSRMKYLIGQTLKGRISDSDCQE